MQSEHQALSQRQRQRPSFLEFRILELEAAPPKPLKLHTAAEQGQVGSRVLTFQLIVLVSCQFARTRANSTTRHAPVRCDRDQHTPTPKGNARFLSTAQQICIERRRPLSPLAAALHISIYFVECSMRPSFSFAQTSPHTRLHLFRCLLRHHNGWDQ